MARIYKAVLKDGTVWIGALHRLDLDKGFVTMIPETLTAGATEELGSFESIVSNELGAPSIVPRDELTGWLAEHARRKAA